MKKTLMILTLLSIGVSGCGLLDMKGARSYYGSDSSTSESTTAKCESGSWSPTGTDEDGCTLCSTDPNSTGKSLTPDNRICICKSGYTWLTDTCISNANIVDCPYNTWSLTGKGSQASSNAAILGCTVCPSDTGYSGSSNDTRTQCTCSAGYGWANNTCIAVESIVPCPTGKWSPSGNGTQLTSTDPILGCSTCPTDATSTGQSENNQTQCQCNSGYVWNSSACAIDKILPTHTLMLSSGNSCPTGTVSLGQIGLLSLDADPLQGYSLGGPYNDKWHWKHPYMCDVTGTTTSLTNSIVFINGTCPTGYTRIGLGSFIFNKQVGPYTTGSVLASGYSWWWQQPIVCANQGNVPLASGSIVLSTDSNCPTGYTMQGQMGFILPNGIKGWVFATGSAYNTSWLWGHPYLCTKN